MNINKYIDYTLLKPKVPYQDIGNFIKTAIENKYRGICTFNEYLHRGDFGYIKDEQEKNKDFKVSIVKGFPFGVGSMKSKLCYYDNSIITDIDIVINLNNLFTPMIDDELRAIRDTYWNKTIKIIIEVELLNEKEIKYICGLCNDYNINFIKTCTGFNGKLTDEKLDLVLKYRGNCKVKASGGIKNRKKAIELIRRGVDVIGTSTIF